MGLIPDEDIVLEMLSLMGPEALELTVSLDSISNKTKSTKHVMFVSDTGCDADESSVTSKSLQSSNIGHDKQSEKIFNILLKKE